jgi:hypothetical protein
MSPHPYPTNGTLVGTSPTNVPFVRIPAGGPFVGTEEAA